MKKLNRKEKERLSELEEKAKDYYINNSDFSIVEWLDTEEEKQEYLGLMDRFLKGFK